MKEVKKEVQMEKPAGPVVALYIACSLTLLSIGALSFLGKAVPSVSSFLVFIGPLGSLSGEIILGYSGGLLSYFVLRQVLSDKNPSLGTWFFMLMGALALSLLLVFPPVVSFLLK